MGKASRLISLFEQEKNHRIHYICYIKFVHEFILDLTRPQIICHCNMGSPTAPEVKQCFVSVTSTHLVLQCPDIKQYTIQLLRWNIDKHDKIVGKVQLSPPKSTNSPSIIISTQESKILEMTIPFLEMELSSHGGPLVATSKQDAKYTSFSGEKIAFYPRVLFSEKLADNRIV